MNPPQKKRNTRFSDDDFAFCQRFSIWIWTHKTFIRAYEFSDETNKKLESFENSIYIGGIQF